MENYILLYGDKKKEDNICIKNMFKNSVKIDLVWNEQCYKQNLKRIQEVMNDKIEQIIFAGLEIGWDKLVTHIKENYPNIKIKVLCNTMDSLLYYEYERENFFKLLELSKQNIIDNIAFFRKGQYELYKQLGYKCSYILENYILDSKENVKVKEKSNIIDIGIYPLNYTWDKNIFNQLCIPKFIENSNLNYNSLDERMEDFLDTMKIKHSPVKIKDINESGIINEIIKNDINISCAFTEYLHPIFFISMELGIPCIIGNTSELFENEEILEKYLVTSQEDNPIVNAEIIKTCIKNKEIILKKYLDWKKVYNEESNKSIQEFLDN